MTPEDQIQAQALAAERAIRYLEDPTQPGRVHPRLTVDWDTHARLGHMLVELYAIREPEHQGIIGSYRRLVERVQIERDQALAQLEALRVERDQSFDGMFGRG